MESEELIFPAPALQALLAHGINTQPQWTMENTIETVTMTFQWNLEKIAEKNKNNADISKQIVFKKEVDSEESKLMTDNINTDSQKQIVIKKEVDSEESMLLTEKQPEKPVTTFVPKRAVNVLLALDLTLPNEWILTTPGNRTTLLLIWKNTASVGHQAVMDSRSNNDVILDSQSIPATSFLPKCALQTLLERNLSLATDWNLKATENCTRLMLFWENTTRGTPATICVMKENLACKRKQQAKETEEQSKRRRAVQYSNTYKDTRRWEPRFNNRFVYSNHYQW